MPGGAPVVGEPGELAADGDLEPVALRVVLHLRLFAHTALLPVGAAVRPVRDDRAFRAVEAEQVELDRWDWTVQPVEFTVGA
ncbi:hypothetical protein GCM10020366_32310 [Saccharopolyspora gregorii]|uniref:Uncharacterized protein n=1 Tax=Saccharopolyspora gregorii TaxID=33914 RepID=A0ABP6RTG5_9PSEU